MILPKWANNNPYRFIAMHRAALESDYVSRMINHWIDLIFGYKQRGKEAEKALNVFFYMTYEDSVDFSKITDNNLRISTESQIIHFGQTPSQLFSKAHPSRPSREQVFLHCKWIADPTAEIRSYKPSSKNRRATPFEEESLFNLKTVGPRAIFLKRLVGDTKLYLFRKDGSFTLLK